MSNITITVNLALLTLLVAQFLAKPLMDIARTLCKRWFNVELASDACILCFAVFYSVLLIIASNYFQVV